MLSSTIFLELAVLSYIHHRNLALSANYLLLKHQIANIAYPMLRTSFKIVDSSKKQENTRSSKSNYQAIYLIDNDENGNLFPSVFEKPVCVKVYPRTRTWQITQGTPHERFEIGRSIGAIFSCKEFRDLTLILTADTVLKCIDEFLQSSTLIPFYSWDPRIRLEPLDIMNR